jgi:hypothetical protein
MVIVAFFSTRTSLIMATRQVDSSTIRLTQSMLQSLLFIKAKKESLLAKKASHLLLNKSCSIPGKTDEQKSSVIPIIILILPGLGNTTTIFEYTIKIKRIARTWCLAPISVKAALTHGSDNVTYTLNNMCFEGI